MTPHVQNAIDKAISAYVATLPNGKGISRLAGLCRSDLYNGPLYFLDGEIASMFDKGAKRFRFTRASAAVKNWCENNLGTMYYDNQTGHLSDKAPSETETCYDCNGKGDYRCKKAHRRKKCETCNGEGELLVDNSEVYEIDATREFLGNELWSTIR